MASLLGKRKRIDRRNIDTQPRDPSPANSSEPEESADLQDIFRRHFEAKFKPLEEHPSSAPHEDSAHSEESEDGSGSDWEGIGSDGEDEQVVQVVEHATFHTPARLSKAEAKAYMSSKPPLNSPNSLAKNAKTPRTAEDDDQGDKLNLKHDLALQRLINESHLLDPAKSASSTGQRQRILDMRLKSLGSKNSILEQEKMPMSHRKGIVAKAQEREARRRQEAKENGIILEKVAKVKKSEEKRVRGVTGPAVGKFRGGTLRLNKKDVADIIGPKRSKRR